MKRPVRDVPPKLTGGTLCTEGAQLGKERGDTIPPGELGAEVLFAPALDELVPSDHTGRFVPEFIAGHGRIGRSPICT